MPIRIRFVHTRYPHWGGRSGFTQIANQLDRDRYHVVLDGASDNDADLPRWLTPLQSPLRRLIRHGGMPWYKLSDLMAEVRALPGSVIRRHDIIHFLDGEHGGLYLPRLLKKMPLARPRTIASFHQPPNLLRTLVNPRVARGLDQVTVVSPSQLPFFLEFLPSSRVHLLPHGVDTQFFHPPVAPRTAGRRIRCITVGHWLRDWRALRGVAEHLRADSDIGFDVVTRGTTGLEDLPNVTHHRALSDDALAERYRRADVLLLPLTECTANNALLEGIASGLPVVSSNLAGVRFYLAGCDALLVPPGDVAALVAAVRRLQNDPAARIAMGQRARWRAEELAWPTVTRRFTQLYESSAVTAAPTPQPGAYRNSDKEHDGYESFRASGHADPRKTVVSRVPGNVDE